MKQERVLSDRVHGINLVVWEDSKAREKSTLSAYISSWELKLHHDRNLSRQINEKSCVLVFQHCETGNQASSSQGDAGTLKSWCVKELPADRNKCS